MSRPPTKPKRPTDRTGGGLWKLPKRFVEPQGNCTTCDRPIPYKRTEDRNGTVRKFCSKACRRARHNPKRRPKEAA